MRFTTIKVSKETRDQLNDLKDYPRETLQDVILKLIKLKGGKS